MEDKESGSLSQKSALDILLELHQGSVTGSLKLERPPLQKAVYFRDGQILFAASNDPKDQLASILVEEGKLGPEQMEVAQARATPGNPLAKVLTELGYISQRELAEAARVKVEKILTDLYTWSEGTYQFATKSLPKGGLDLALSTSRLLFASIRRLQDREWVLNRLGSLEAVLRPSPTFDQFLAEAEPEDAANDTLRLADGVKTVKQIGALSSLGEFDVCKVLAAALVAGGLQDAAAPAVVASSDAFSFPSNAPAFEPPSFEPAPPSFEPPPIQPPPPPAPSSSSSSSGSSIFGSETVGLETQPPRASSDTVFQAPPQEPAEESEKTIFDDMPSPSATGAGSSRTPSFGQPTSASQLLVDEPEPESDFPTRTPPKPKGMRRGGGGGSGGIGGALKWAAVFVLAAGAGFALYTFGWPMLANGGGGAGGGDPQTGVTTTTTATEGGATDPGTRIIGGGQPGGTPTTTPATASGTDPRATGTGTGTGTATGTTTPPGTGTETATATATSSAPPTPRPAPATTTTPTPAATTSTPSPRPAPAPAPAPAGGGNGRSLLAGGKVVEAAQAFQRELASAQDQFTIAVGLYCNSDNVLRIASGINDRSLYVLPTSIDGKRCFRVIWGLYPSRDAASNGMRSLPSGIRAGDAAVVDLSRLLR